LTRQLFTPFIEKHFPRTNFRKALKMQINFKNARIDRALVAALKIRKQSVETVLMSDNINSILSSAMQDQIQRDFSAEKIGDDVKGLVSHVEYFNAAWRSFQGEGDIPESIVVALEGRASLVSIPAGA